MLLIWGLDENGKKLKKGLLASGAPKAFVKKCLQFYKRIRTNGVQTVSDYHRVKELAGRILQESREAEQLMIKEEALSEEEKKRLCGILADFSKIRPQLDFEFVISHADREIHMTLEGMEKLGNSWLAGKSDKLILQSEVENLIALVKEALEKEKPALEKLAVFYIGHSNKELEEISYSGKLMFVEEIYRREYLDLLRDAVQIALDGGYLESEERDAEAYLNSIIRI